MRKVGHEVISIKRVRFLLFQLTITLIEKHINMKTNRNAHVTLSLKKIALVNKCI